MNILMVCLGNICRSPLAEGLLREKLNEYGLHHIQVDSAGTSGYHSGEPADKRTVENALKNGVDLTSIRSRQFTPEDFDRFDQIYVMDESNYENVVSLARNQDDISKVELLLNCIEPACNAPVPDPYFGGPDGFEIVFRLVEKATVKLAENLKQSHGENIG